MKIGPLETKQATAAALSERKPAGTTSVDKGAASTEASAQVEISSSASLMAGAADPTFDAAKVERIAAAIRDGSFKIDAEKIADKLIANSQDLLKRYSSN